MTRTIETRRLRLRPICASDAETIYETWARDSEVTRYLTWQPHENVEVTRAVVDTWVAAYDREDTFRWGIERKEDGVLMGMIDMVGYRDGAPVIGYCSGRAFWNNGYMTAALGAVTAELFSAGFDRISMEAVAENIGSNRVIQKAGFRFLGVRPAEVFEGKPWIKQINRYELCK